MIIGTMFNVPEKMSSKGKGSTNIYESAVSTHAPSVPFVSRGLP